MFSCKLVAEVPLVVDFALAPVVSTAGLAVDFTVLDLRRLLSEAMVRLDNAALGVTRDETLDWVGLSVEGFACEVIVEGGGLRVVFLRTFELELAVVFIAGFVAVDVGRTVCARVAGRGSGSNGVLPLSCNLLVNTEEIGIF
jgi:hypothetical protein